MKKTVLSLAAGAAILLAGATGAHATCTYHVKLQNNSGSGFTVDSVGTNKNTGPSHQGGNVDDFVVPANSGHVFTFLSIKRKTNTDVYFGVKKKGGSWYWAKEKQSCYDSYVRYQNGNPVTISLN